MTYRAVTKTDQKSVLSLLGRLRSSKFCFTAISRIFYISVLAGKYQRCPKHLVFKTVKEDVGTGIGLPLKHSPDVSWLWLPCPSCPGWGKPGLGSDGSVKLVMQEAAAASGQEQSTMYGWPGKSQTQMRLTKASFQNPVPPYNSCAVITETVSSCLKRKMGLTAFPHRAWLLLGLQLSLWGTVLALTDH